MLAKFKKKKDIATYCPQHVAIFHHPVTQTNISYYIAIGQLHPCNMSWRLIFPTASSFLIEQ